LGYQYSNIPDPLQALPLLIEYKPKLIFLDLVMPIANGYEVCAQIRRISALKEIPVIIVTSNDGIADRVRARLVGASGFLGKPIQHKKVAKVIKKHLRQIQENNPTPKRQDVLSPL
jgi:two-component system, chemotaxis family, response regulator PixG